MRRIALTAALALFVPASTPAQEVCAVGDFSDPRTYEEMHLEMLVETPADEAEVGPALAGPGCSAPLQVGGIASTLRIPARFDVYVVLDTSGSTSWPSGVDLDGDGREETILQAEVVAALAFINAVDLGYSRVAVIEFNEIARTVVPLSQDRAELVAGLEGIRDLGPGDRTDYGAGAREAVMEHDRHGNPDHEQVVLFLTDGDPNTLSSFPPYLANECPLPPPAPPQWCSGILWAWYAYEWRGMQFETFAVGERPRATVLELMAEHSSGRYRRVTVAGDVARVLPEITVVGIGEVRVENLDTGEQVVAEIGPDGRFHAEIPIVEGANDLVVTTVADHPRQWSVSCRRRVYLSCASYECPEPVQRECEGGGASIESLKPWVSHDEIRVSSDHDPDGDGDAGGVYPLGLTAVEFLLADAFGNERSCTTSVEVVDTLAPTLLGVPPDVDLECTEPLPDPPVVTAEDRCEPDLPVVFEEMESVHGCPANRDLRRSWTVTDSSGHSAQAGQLIRVRDTQPPVVQAGDGDLLCFRSPNHWRVPLGRGDFHPIVTDACSEVVAWVFTGCESDQPDDDRGDGRTVADCQISADGESLLLRGERDGREQAGRRYAISVAALDACGNWSEPARIGHVRILHDLRDGGHDCPQVPKAGGHR